MKHIRLFVCLLAAALLLAGCAGQTKEETKGTVTEGQTANAETAGSAAGSTEAGDAAPSTAAGQADPAPSDNGGTAAAPAGLSLGRVTGGTYENRYFGFGVELGDGWVFYNDEELAQLSGLTAEALQDAEAVQKELEKSGNLFDMFAGTEDGLTSVNVTLEDLGTMYGSLLSEEDYVDYAIDGLPQTMTAAGAEDVTAEKTELLFAGAKHAGIRMSYKIRVDEETLVQVYQLMACVQRDKYMADVTATCYLEDTTDELLAPFYQVK